MFTALVFLFGVGLGIALGLEGRRERVVYRERVIRERPVRQRLYILRTAHGETRPIVAEVEGKPWHGWEDTLLAFYGRDDVLLSELGAFDELRRHVAERRA